MPLSLLRRVRDKAIAKANAVVPGGVQAGINRVTQNFQNPFTQMQQGVGPLNTPLPPVAKQAAQGMGALGNYVFRDMPQGVARSGAGVALSGMNILQPKEQQFQPEIDVASLNNPLANLLWGKDQTIRTAKGTADYLDRNIRDYSQEYLGEEMNVPFPLLMAAGVAAPLTDLLPGGSGKKKVASKALDVGGDLLKAGKAVDRVPTKPVAIKSLLENFKPGSTLIDDATRLSNKYGFDKSFVEDMLQKSDPSRVERVLSYTNEAPGVKNKQAYATATQNTDFFQAQPGKPGIKSVKSPEVVVPKEVGEVPEISRVETVEEVLSVPEKAKEVVKQFETEMINTSSWEKAQPRVQKSLENINAQFFAKNKSFDDVANELLSGKKNKDTFLLESWFEVFRKNAEADGVEIPKTFKQYVTQITKDRAIEKLNTPMKPKTAGDVLNEMPFFGKKRTQPKTEPLTIEAMEAYAKESFINRVDNPVTQKEIRWSNNLVKEIKQQSKLNLDQTVTGGRTVNIVERVKEIADPGVPKTIISGGDKSVITKGANSLLRSVDDRVALVKDPQFYDKFLWPFKESQMKVSQFVEKIKGLDQQKMSNLYKKSIGQNPRADMSIGDMYARIVLDQNTKANASATNIYLNNLKNTEFKEPWVADLANDIFDQYVTRNIRTPQTAEKVLGFIRSQTGRGALGLNFASAINNIFELRRSFSAISSKNFAKGIQRVASGERFAEKYGIQSIYGTALERVTKDSRFSSFVEKMDKTLFYMFDKSEKLKDELMLAGFEQQGMQKGLKGKDLNKFVIQKFSQFAVKYGKGQDIGLYRSPLVKTLAQFGQYAIKDAVITSDKIGGVIKGDKGDISYVLKYVGSSIAQALLFKEVMGTIGFGGVTSTSWDLVQDIYEGELPLSPSVKTLLLFSQTVGDELKDTEISDYDLEQRRKSMIRSGAVSIVPASNQLGFKTGQTIQNQLRGHQEKFGGNVANPVSTDPVNRLKTLMFGPSYDPQRQDAIDRYKSGEKYGLTAAESNVFKNLPKDQRQAYFDSVMERPENVKNASSVKQEEKPGVLQRMFGSKESEITFNWDNKPTTTQEKKDFNAAVNEALEAGLEVPDNAIKQRFFNGTDYQTAKTITDREKVISKMASVMGDEFLTDEQKEQILKVSGIKEKDIEYYQAASLSARERTDALTSFVSDFQGERQDLLISVALNRRTVAGKSLNSKDDIDKLYDDGLISKEEKALLNAIKFDEIKGEFYMDRDYKGSGGGSSAKTIMNKINSVYKFEPTKMPKFDNRVNLTQDLFEARLPKITRSRRTADLFTPY